MGGREVQVVARPFLQPLADPGCFVRSVVVAYQMKLQLCRNHSVDAFQKIQEFHRPVARIALAEHASTGHIQSGKWAGHAMPLIVLRTPLELPRPLGQH